MDSRHLQRFRFVTWWVGMAAFVIRLMAPEPYATPLRVVFYAAFAAGVISLLVERLGRRSNEKTGGY
jgi:hypothetical protein